ncbi:hypothetical protein HID58_054012 [Brassica napus]|uniref:Uncharacterized protein n=1 Tax=Brassica napus TaxID=3708 RepID=A0ABQ8AGP3_BRANA|nr:hypothetical protein HID58_054012 [Brassica napus]
MLYIKPDKPGRSIYYFNHLPRQRPHLQTLMKHLTPIHTIWALMQMLSWSYSKLSAEVVQRFDANVVMFSLLSFEASDELAVRLANSQPP